MSGDPPRSFQYLTKPDNPQKAMNADEFSQELSKWLGVEGVLDMRSYLRFRVLEQFKPGFVTPGKVEDEGSPISDVDVALNLLVVDFLLRQKYFFSLCVILPEMSVPFGKDRRFDKLKSRLSSLGSTMQSSSATLLDKELIDEGLKALNVEPGSGIGSKITENYCAVGNTRSLLQIIAKTLNHVKSYGSPGSPSDGEQKKQPPEVTPNQTILRNEILEGIDLQIKELRQLVLFKGSKQKYNELHDDVGELREKVTGIFPKIDEHGDRIGILTNLVRTLRTISVQILRRCSSYVELILSMQQKLGTFETTVRKLTWRLGKQSKQLSSLRCRRFRSKFIKFRPVLKQKHVCDASIQTDSPSVQCINICDGSAQTLVRLDSIPHQGIKSSKIENDNPEEIARTRAKDRLDQILNDFSTNPATSPFVGPGGVESQGFQSNSCSSQAKPNNFEAETSTMNINSINRSSGQLHTRIQQQGIELEKLSTQIVSLEKKILNPREAEENRQGRITKNTFVQTMDSFQQTSLPPDITRPKQKYSKSCQLCVTEAYPLETLVISAKLEIAALKRERRYLEEESVIQNQEKTIKR
ncbi:Hypothetical protein NTJ_03861 [Nesidiocoris tenuis]|uniref:LisH domain-containing protein n=1 Tax=Nesidiocoris tenuis TaxID=355587 RepID=A0ABN7AG80_9HEMI|nr:Hypothetical protein NTJ_03861 [Nesidiocoris tenuis]